MLPYPSNAGTAWREAAANQSSLASLQPLPLSPTASAKDMSACLAACAARPGCGAALYDATAQNCTLSYLRPRAAAVASAPVFSACSGNASRGTPCTLSTRTPGSCGLSASSGVLGVGQVWAGWAPGGASGPWGKASAIDSALQNVAMPTPSDCLCLCTYTSRCVGYVWLGSNQRCWLQDTIAFGVGLQADASPLTVTGRVETAGERGATGAMREGGRNEVCLHRAPAP